MKALQKNQGRTDQMLGAMADVLTSVAMPNQQWVSGGPVCVFMVCLHEKTMPQIQNQSNKHIWRYLSGLAGHETWQIRGPHHCIPGLFIVVHKP